MPRKKRQKRSAEMVRMKAFLFGPHVKTESRFKMMETRLERVKLLKTLIHHEDERIVNLCNHLRDPVFDNTSVVVLCKRCGLDLRQLTKAFKEVSMNLGLINMYDHVPQVMADVVEDAKSRDVYCPRCDGTGSIKDDTKPPVEDEAGAFEVRDCPNCEGEGKVRKAGDADARKIVFESIGLTGKRGPMVNIQQNMIDGGDSLEDMLGNMGKRTALPMPTKVEQLPTQEAEPEKEAIPSGSD